MLHSISATVNREILFQAGGESTPIASPAIATLSLKTKQVALAIFAVLFFFTGLISLTALKAGLITAIPAVALGIGCIWLMSRIKAYDDPVALKSYQERALYQSLEKTVKEHGWENMIKYSIPSKESFSQIYMSTIKEMTTKEAVRFWEEATQAQKEANDPFTIPPADFFQAKWFTEIKGMTVVDVLSTYEVSKYIELGFAHPKLDEAIRLFDDLYQQLKRNQITAAEMEHQVNLINLHYEDYLEI